MCDLHAYITALIILKLGNFFVLLRIIRIAYRSFSLGMYLFTGLSRGLAPILNNDKIVSQKKLLNIP